MQAAMSRKAKLVLARVLYRTGVVGTLLHLRRRQPLVLRYHRVYAEGEAPLYELGVPRSVFEAQLYFLKRRFRVVPLATIYDGLFGNGPLL